MFGSRATAGEPAAATPMAAPAIHASSMAHPRPDVRTEPNSFHQIEHLARRQRGDGSLVLVEEDHFLVPAHLLGNGFELRIRIRFLRHSSLSVSLSEAREP
jgi:hypothetical protein